MNSSILSFEHNCPIQEQTADGNACGRCWFYLPDGKTCPRHGDVSIAVEHYKRTGQTILENEHYRQRFGEGWEELIRQSHSRRTKMDEVVRVIEQSREAHQSRWGYHPCTFETFLKLKQLAVVVRRAERICCQFKRWFRKSPHNRVARRRIRNEKGWVVAYGDPVPIPEPVGHDVLTGKLSFKRHIDINGVYHNPEVTVEFVHLTDVAKEIVKCRNAAGRPVAGPELVERLTLSDVQIDDLHGRLCGKEMVTEWFRQWNEKKVKRENKA